MTRSPEVLEVVTETASVSKRDVVTGKVRVTTRTETTEELVGADLASEHWEVSRVPRDIEIDAAPAVRTEGDVTIVPVVEEILVVEKRLILKEEIHLRRTVSTEAVELPVTLRQQRVVIDETSQESTPTTKRTIP